MEEDNPQEGDTLTCPLCYNIIVAEITDEDYYCKICCRSFTLEDMEYHLEHEE